MKDDNDTDTLLTIRGGKSSAGHVVSDNGRNVWQWNDSQLDSTTILLKKLDNSALKLETTRRVRALRRAAEESQRGKSLTLKLELADTINADKGCSFDPYNRG